MRNIKVNVVVFGDRPHYQMQFVDPITRKKKTRSTGVLRTADRKSRVEAERVAAKWEAELREGRYADPSKMTWSEFRSRYETEALSGLAEKTDVKSQVTFNLVERILNPEKLRDVTAERLSYFVAELRKREKVGDKLRPARAETTIVGYLAHLRAALAWGAAIGLIDKVPTFPEIKRAKNSVKMKGRGIAREELERMIDKLGVIMPESKRNEWTRFLEGLWLSGLRLGESLNLTWDDPSKLMIDWSGAFPLLHIPAELQKNHRDQLMPLAPEFVEFLVRTPTELRTGFVFKPQQRNASTRVTARNAMRIISDLGRRAGVKVHVHPTTKSVKHASAHDLRRAFGERWAPRVMPTILQQMMRHESIETTLRFYVGRNAEAAAKVIWDAYRQETGNKSGNTSSARAADARTQERP